MPAYVHADRQMSLTTPLGPDKLLLVGVRGQEAISQLFHFELDLVSEEPSIAFDRLLGQKVTVEWRLGDGEKRYLNGIVSRFSQCERSMTFTRFRMEAVPSLWLLTRQLRSRIFQHIPVPDILKKVFDGLDVSYQLVGNFEPRDYCAQYRETDFQFASRLMEEEGIFYFFTHGADGHQMVVANSPQCHRELPNAHVIYEELIGGVRDEERIWHWEKSQQLRSGKATLWDHCFELPGKNLEAVKTTLETVQIGRTTHKLKVGGNDSLELYDYPGGYAQRFDGVDKGGGAQPDQIQKIFDDNGRTVEIRMQAETTPALTTSGAGDCREFVSGAKFSLDRHFSDDGSYVITGVEHICTQPMGTTSGAPGPFHYENHFTCIPSAVPYRPARVTPAPVVRGSQTAIVVGPSGEEIFTDKYGRVKVQFHWDRDGQNDIESSCWVRVATHWAGKQWGAIHIPRMGQEVIVDFLEGDPDRPIIVGSVYNAEQIPPYDLPENKTQSGIKSRSSKGGSPDNFNEIRFEDLKDSELVYVHAEKDMTTEVENDELRDVGHDRTTDIHHDETKTVDHDQTLTVKHNRTATVQANDKETVEGNQEVQVNGDQKQTIGGTQTENITGDQKLTVTGQQTVTITSSRSVTIASSDSLTVASSRSATIAGSDSLTCVGGLSITTGGAVTITAGGGVTILSGGPMSITAPMVSMTTAMLQVAGVVQCISVVSPTYTPGVGNMI